MKAKVRLILLMMAIFASAIAVGTAQAAPVKMAMSLGGMCQYWLGPAGPVLGKATIDAKKPGTSPGFQQVSVEVDVHGLARGQYTLELTSCEPFGGPFLGWATWPTVAGIDGKVHVKGAVQAWTGPYSFQVVVRYASGALTGYIAAITAPTTVTVP